MENATTTIDPAFRPASYFWPLGLAKHLLARVKGAQRKKALQALIDAGRLDDIPDFLARSALSEAERQAIGRLHPAFMGGEYLPDMEEEEVEIARISIHSTTGDVTSVYARRTPEGIAYRVVDEYGGDTLSGDNERESSLPLTLGELADFFLGSWSLIDVLEANYEDDLDGMLGFFWADSAFYPHLDTLLRQRVREHYEATHDEPADEDEDEDANTFTVLEVDAGNALWLAGYESPDTRAGIYGISPDDVTDAKTLLGLAEDCVPLADRLRYEFECFRSDREDELAGLEEAGEKGSSRAKALRAQLKRLPENPEEGPAVWLPAMTVEEFAPLRESVSRWLADRPDGDYEEDYFPNPADGRTAAMQLLQSEDRDIREALGVVIIEGEHPGSTYYAAELEKPIAEANQEAERLGLAYRFVRQGEAVPEQDSPES